MFKSITACYQVKEFQDFYTHTHTHTHTHAHTVPFCRLILSLNSECSCVHVI